MVHVRSIIALALALLLLALGFASLSRRARFFTTPRPFRWIPVSWCLLFFVSNVKTDRLRDAADALGGSLNNANRIELIAYLLVAPVVATVWFSLRLRRSEVIGWPLFAWPSFALVSTAWSPIPMYTFVRASQLLVVVTLGLLCLNLALRHPGIEKSIVADALRLFVIVTALLSSWGLVEQSGWEEGRFMWPIGQHPIVVGMFGGIALLVVLIGGHSMRLFPWPLQSLFIGLFSLVLILGQNRSVLIATSLGLLISLWAMRGGKEVWARYVAIPVLLCAGLAAAILAGQAVLTYFERGQSAHSILTLTGRTDLWATSLRQLKTPGEWLLGFGYGSPRVILASLVEWAGQAHNSFVELLLALGLIGALAAVASVIAVGYRVLSAKHLEARPSAAVEASIFAMLVIMAMAEAVLVSPGLGFSMFCFVFFAACSRSVPPNQTDHGRWGMETLVGRRISPVTG